MNYIGVFMSLQGATEGSGSPKSKSKGLSALRAIFTYDRTGSLNDRLLTAFYMLVCAFVMSIVAVKAPYGGFVCVAFAAAIVSMSIFEVVRLFARDHDTLHYRPIAGTIMFAILGLPGIVSALSAVQSVVYGTIWWQAIYVATIVAVGALMVALSLEGRQRLENAARFAERYGVAFWIVGVCAPALITISGLSRGIYLLWWLVGCAALNDAAAYFIGRAFGAHRMAPGLSPNKSIEGSVAGVVVGTLAGALLWNSFVGAGASLWAIVLISFLVVVACQAGDLTKSYLKRLRGVKDMGAIFPGHGGVLDRFDAMLAAAPVALAALCILGVV
jgi:phosphatidate cytidylyltransferase